MGREGTDPVVLQYSSSIALLQERFRQLQRLKEMREEKELLRVLTDPPPNNLFNVPASTPSHEPFKLLFQPDFGLPQTNTSPYSPQLSLSLWSCPQRSSSSSYLHPMETPVFVGSGLPRTRYLKDNLHNKSQDFDDVDTSLHL